MLMVMRRLGEGERHLRAGAWGGLRPTFMLGRTLRGKTLGIIGYGRIGRAMARTAQAAFGMHIIYHAPRDPRIDDPATAGPADAERVGTLEELLQRSDVVSLHCPATAETRHLMNARTLGLMKPDAYLVNTARGDVIDERALVHALTERTIAGAGLDVFEFEPSVTAELMEMEQVVLLPHLGSATIETRTAMGMRALKNVDAYAQGQASRPGGLSASPLPFGAMIHLGLDRDLHPEPPVPVTVGSLLHFPEWSRFLRKPTMSLCVCRRDIISNRGGRIRCSICTTDRTSSTICRCRRLACSGVWIRRRAR